MVNGHNKKGKAVTAFPLVVLEIDCFYLIPNFLAMSFGRASL
jgi:hypothetical protein